METSERQSTPLFDETKVRAMLLSAQEGDPAALAELRALISIPHVMEMTGNLSKIVENRIIDMFLSEHIWFREATTAKVRQMRTDLLGPNPTPIETLLVDRVVVTWLRLHCAELCQTARDVENGVSQRAQRNLDRLHRRHQLSLQSLAAVRKLALPVLKNQMQAYGP